MMPLRIEDVDDALPYRLPLENLFDGFYADQDGRSAMLGLYRSLKLVGAYFHTETLSWISRFLHSPCFRFSPAFEGCGLVGLLLREQFGHGGRVFTTAAVFPEFQDLSE